jgi:hypothetical protein
MTKRLIGLVASVALMGSGMAFANEGVKKQESQQSQGATGGSGSMGAEQSGQMGQSEQVSGNKLTGRVVKSEKKMVWLEHMGAIVPLKIDKNTQFNDPSLKKATDIKEGDEIRASFEVRKTDNVATSIEKSISEGTGGSGTEVMSPDSSINQPPGTLPADEGTGGSGRDDLSAPDINSGGDVGGSDVNPGADKSHPEGDY